MSSDGFFDDSAQVDTAFLAELDAIEAVHSNATQPPPPRVNSPLGLSTVCRPVSTVYSATLSLSCDSPGRPSQPQPGSQGAHSSIDVDADELYSPFFDSIDLVELERLDKDVQDAYNHENDMSRQQTLLDNTPAPALARPPSSLQQFDQSRRHRSPRNPFGKKSQKLKRWDHTAFAKTGWISGKNTLHGKAKARTTDCDGVAEEAALSNEEFEQFPAPVADKYAFSPPPPFKHKPDLLATQTWIYPTNKPKRDYQFNIVRDSLFENTLVSLPTGLGKTFIAGVVMLNYYRWFPEGKIVFVAPTKPLVAQQIDACHKTCGIPGGDAAELTGQIPKATRAAAWAEKHIFYMTPQTLMNDLKTENCDPTDIVLLVIDEAHRGTGNYAYAQVVRYLMAKTAHFRVLALTATPGSKPQAVQAIIDSLHISNIAIRDENSIDIRPYLLPKKISIHIIKMTANIIKVRDMLAKLMEKIAKRMIDTGLVHNLNVVTLHSYRCNALMQQFSQDGTGKKFPWVYDILKKLGVLARAMGYLLESSIAMCHDEMHGMFSEVDQAGKRLASLRGEPLFKDIIKELEQQHNSCYSIHPKLEKLQSLAVDYFAQAKADSDEAVTRSPLGPVVEANSPDGEGKMMVFTNFRSSVDEIVELLNAQQPMIRAVRFIGQGSDKQGRKGITQKDQLEVIKKFKEGFYNVLVATSIGEEGLDIGEVDIIICYDAQKTPIRMLQRVGRTGRKRAGRVEVLLSEAREEANWDKAKSDYEFVQSSIIRGESLELYADVDRLLPDHIKPKCVETTVAIEEYARDARPSHSSASMRKPPKRKRNIDVKRNIPEGAVKGFIASSKLIPRGDRKRCRVAPQELDLNGVGDDHGRAIQDWLPPKVSRGRGKMKAKTRLKTNKRDDKDRLCNNIAVTDGMTLSQLDRELEDDTDDMEIEIGIKFSSPECPRTAVSSWKSQVLSSPMLSPVCTHSSRELPCNAAEAEGVFGRHSQRSREFQTMEDHSWLLDSDDDIKVIEDISPSVDFCRKPMLGRCELSTPMISSSLRLSPLSRASSEKRKKQNNPLLPSNPAHSLLATPTTYAFPESTFPVRRPGIRRKRPPQSSFSPTFDSLSKNAQASSPASSPHHPMDRSRQHRGRINSQAKLELLDLEAQVSGDENMSDSSDHDDVERESDRLFVEELPPTQASPNYDQTSAYRRSLFTQTPGHLNVPQFTSKPVKQRTFGPERQSLAAPMSSSPTKDQVADEYSIDSFLVEDDDNVLHEDSCSSDI